MKKITTLLLSLAIGFSAFSYTPAPFNNHDYTVSHERVSLPTKYDSRDLGIILPARNQGQSGCCWAFTATDVAQALFHKNGYETGYLAPQIYPNCAIGYLNLDMTTGGNEYIAISTNALLKAPVFASSVGELDLEKTDCPIYTKDDIAGYILSSSDLPSNDKIAIKEAIMNYGSVISSLVYGDSYLDKETNIYEFTEENYATNHAVNIIGWDDSKNAWLVKNSWGPNWGDNGTFWVSYNDAYISKACVSLNSFVGKDEISNVYTYNTAGITGGFMGITGGNNRPHTILVAHKINEGETIEYVATYVQNPNTKVQIVIQENNTENTVVYEGEEETVKYAGLYLHKLTEPLASKGDTLLFQIAYTSDKEKPVATEIEREDYNTIELNKNQWFFINNTWKPATEFGYNFILYVYTKEQEVTTQLEEEDIDNTSILTGGQINPEIWNDAVQITVFDISGRNYGTIKQGEAIPTLNKGYYVLVVDKKDGSFAIEKFNVFL